MSTAGGWEYDEDYKKELDRPSTWEESTPIVNDWTQPTSASHIADAGGTDSCHYGAPAPRRGGVPLSSPNPGLSSRTHTNRGGFSLTNYSSRGGVFSDQAANHACGTRGRCNDYAFHDVYEPQHNCKQSTNQRHGYAHNYTPEERFSKLKIANMTANARDAKANNLGAFNDHQGAGSCPTNSGVNFDAYEEIPVEATGDCVPPPMETFEAMECDSIVHQNLKRCGYTQPTPVQKYAIPICMNGRDLMACAQTGSGKTAAFCVPVVAGILRGRSACANNGKPNAACASCSPLALILSPTRELACQVL